MAFLQLVGEQHLMVSTHMERFTTLLQQLQQGNLLSLGHDGTVSTHQGGSRDLRSRLPLSPTHEHLSSCVSLAWIASAEF